MHLWWCLSTQSPTESNAQTCIATERNFNCVNSARADTPTGDPHDTLVPHHALVLFPSVAVIASGGCVGRSFRIYERK